MSRQERPILFNGPMVRALLDGSKTQTRRVMKPQPAPIPDEPANLWWPSNIYQSMVRLDWMKERPEIYGEVCPHGDVGDSLWVRETWGVVSNDWDDNCNLADWTPDRPATAITEMRFGQGYYSGHAIYAADGHYEWAGDDDGGGEPRSAWHASIHMPRAASRILLEIVSVRVERLQDISNVDSLAEGIHKVRTHEWDTAHFPAWRRAFDEACARGEKPPLGPAPRESYRALWEDINGAGSWSANPWVWVVEFKRVTP